MHATGNNGSRHRQSAKRQKLTQPEGPQGLGRWQQQQGLVPPHAQQAGRLLPPGHLLEEEPGYDEGLQQPLDVLEQPRTVMTVSYQGSVLGVSVYDMLSNEVGGQPGEQL